jgi:hypothetical protein
LTHFRPLERLRRILSNGLTVMSLLLCLAVAADWVNSYRAYWFIHRSSISAANTIVSDRGAIFLRETTNPAPLKRNTARHVRP